MTTLARWPKQRPTRLAEMIRDQVALAFLKSRDAKATAKAFGLDTRTVLRVLREKDIQADISSDDTYFIMGGGLQRFNDERDPQKNPTRACDNAKCSWWNREKGTIFVVPGTTFDPDARLSQPDAIKPEVPRATRRKAIFEDDPGEVPCAHQ